MDKPIEAHNSLTPLKGMDVDETVADMEKRIDAAIAAACPDASDATPPTSISLNVENMNLPTPQNPSAPPLPLAPASQTNYSRTVPEKKKPQPLMSVVTTFASVASKPKRDAERVEHILHVYATQNKKQQISSCDWDYVLEHLIDLHQEHVLNGKIDPSLIKVAHTGFDATHGCGFIACRTSDSAAWHKKAVAMMKDFRAWAKGDTPPVRLCRIYLPIRFDNIPETKVIALIKAYNSDLKEAEITLKKTESLQGGRALFAEIDQDAYSIIRNKHYKLEFILGDIDCHGVVANNPPMTKDSSDAKSTSRSGTAAILPANAVVELAKISKRDPRIKTAPTKVAEECESDSSISSCSTTSSRGAAKYKPPARRSSPSTTRDDKTGETQGRSRRKLKPEEPQAKGSPLKRGRDPSTKGKTSPGNPTFSKKDKKH
jgi:hypothetical protein